MNEFSSSCPNTYEEVIEWFCTGKRITHDEKLLRKLLDGMLSKPDPVVKCIDVTPSKAWNWIIDFGLLFKGGRSGWITPKGEFYSAAYAAHERLLYWLDIDTKDAEAAGWARFNHNYYQCAFRVSAAQKRILVESGHEIDMGKERLKPRWPGNPVLSLG